MRAELAARHGARFDSGDPLYEAATALEQASQHLHLRVDEGRVVQAFGSPLAGIELADPSDAEAAEQAARGFLREHAALFGLTAEQLDERAIELDRVRAAGPLRLDFRQLHGGLRVIDGDFALGFDARGRLTRLVGTPWGADRLPTELRPSLALEQAATRAIELAAERWDTPNPRDCEVEPELVVRGADGRLLWAVELQPLAPGGAHARLLIDAHDGELLEFETEAEHGAQRLRVRHYRHYGGEDGISDQYTGKIWTNVHSQVSQNGVDYCRYALQRLGSGRARMWNAKHESPKGTPDFPQVVSDYHQCSEDPDIFTLSDDDSDSDWQFNAQTTYYWSQLLKSAVDRWGRDPNGYGHYPIDNSSRRTNVEIVVNAQGAAEGYWCGGDVMPNGASNWGWVMHGCFNSKIDSGWFDDHPEGSDDRVPTVFLYNHAYNKNSPQYHGSKVSPDYGIIIHEVGHFVSWTYGSWRGSGSGMGGSLNEGTSMVLPILFAKERWGSALGYNEAEDVSTGGRWGGRQWSQHDAGDSPERYSSFDCSIDRYKRAWPFVQAIWHLAQNRDESGDAIWTDDEDAVDNTIDLVMWALYHDTANSSMTWDKLVWDLVYYQLDRLDDGTEKSPLPYNGSAEAVVEVFDAHGLLDPCD